MRMIGRVTGCSGVLKEKVTQSAVEARVATVLALDEKRIPWWIERKEER